MRFDDLLKGGFIVIQEGQNLPLRKFMSNDRCNGWLLFSGEQKMVPLGDGEEGDPFKRDHDAGFRSNAQCERSESSSGSRPRASDLRPRPHA